MTSGCELCVPSRAVSATHAAEPTGFEIVNPTLSDVALAGSVIDAGTARMLGLLLVSEIVRGDGNGSAVFTVS